MMQKVQNVHTHYLLPKQNKINEKQTRQQNYTLKGSENCQNSRSSWRKKANITKKTSPAPPSPCELYVLI